MEANLDGVKLDIGNLSLEMRELILNGAYEYKEKELCEKYLSAGDAVLEVGGAIGFLGLFCQKQIGITRYATVEANPRTMELLRKNYELNSLKPTVWNMALAEADGTIELNLGTNFWEDSIVAASQQSRGPKVSVPSATLETLLNKADFRANVLLLDVEGAEKYINFDHVTGNIDKIIIELHPRVLGHDTTYRIVSRLMAHGFEVAEEARHTFVFLKRDRQKPETLHANVRATAS
ncbi:MAG: hypothetical protein JWQ71_3153 [Pedosphaera sp.]|nr:hypothetical protein [Pedosphaera sp.]